MILVTGGCGFIGSHLVRLLASFGHDVAVFDLLTYAGSRARIEGVPHRFVQGDVCEVSQVLEALRYWQPTHVAHLAAETHVTASIDQPARFLRANAQGTLGVLEAMRAWRAESGRTVRLLHVSTDEVYGSHYGGAPWTELQPLAPTNPYSASKAAAEQLVSGWAGMYGQDAVVARCANNYGPGQYPEKLIPLTLHRLLRGECPRLHGDGSHKREWLWVGDCAGALMGLLLGERRGVFNVPGRMLASNLTVVWQLCDLLDAELGRARGTSWGNRQFDAPRQGDDVAYCMDGAKIAVQQGWTPTVGLETGLRDTVRWHIQQSPVPV